MSQKITIGINVLILMVRLWHAASTTATTMTTAKLLVLNSSKYGRTIVLVRFVLLIRKKFKKNLENLNLEELFWWMSM